MANLINGVEVAREMRREVIAQIEQLKSLMVTASLAMVRVGAQPESVAYERAAFKRMKQLGISCVVYAFSSTISQRELEKKLLEICDDKAIHGVLVLRPLPQHLDAEAVGACIPPKKDVDGMCAENMGKLFWSMDGFHTPCTASAVVRMLDYYKIEAQGKNVVLVGSSLVVGRPLALMLFHRNATVTMCHILSEDVPEICRRGEIVISATGKPGLITGKYLSKGCVLIDVGVHIGGDGKIEGDVNFTEAANVAAWVTDPNGGVGPVTTMMLALHVTRAAIAITRT